MLDHALVTTGLEFQNYKIVKNLGVVRGVVVRSRSIIANLGASIQTIFGGNITLLTSLCAKVRADAFELMLEHAKQLGANAIIGMRYDACDLAPGVSEILVYGTAVVVEPR